MSFPVFNMEKKIFVTIIENYRLVTKKIIVGLL